MVFWSPWSSWDARSASASVAPAICAGSPCAEGTAEAVISSRSTDVWLSARRHCQWPSVRNRPIDWSTPIRSSNRFHQIAGPQRVSLYWQALYLSRPWSACIVWARDRCIRRGVSAPLSISGAPTHSARALERAAWLGNACGARASRSRGKKLSSPYNTSLG